MLTTHNTIDTIHIAMTVMSLPRTSIDSTLAFKTLNLSKSPSPHNHQLNRYKLIFVCWGLFNWAITGASSLQWVWFPWGQQTVLPLTDPSTTKERLYQDAREWWQDPQICCCHGKTIKKSPPYIIVLVFSQLLSCRNPPVLRTRIENLSFPTDWLMIWWPSLSLHKGMIHSNYATLYH